MDVAGSVADVHERELLEKILENQETIMAAIDDLNTAVANNTTAVAAVQAEVASLQSSSNEAAVAAAASQIDTNNAALNALVPTPTAAPADAAPVDPTTGGAVQTDTPPAPAA